MGRAFEQVIALNLEKFGPEAARLHHIEVARAGLARFLAGQSPRPDVTIEVDGHPAASETQVRPFGVITYHFARLRQVCLFAYEQARALSPVGHEPKKAPARHYRDAWFFLVDDKECKPDAIPNDAKRVILTNDQPYARKINVGSKGFEAYAPPGIAEKVRLLVNKRFGATVEAHVEFLTLAGGHKLATPIVRGRHTYHEVTYPAIVLERRSLI